MKCARCDCRARANGVCGRHDIRPVRERFMAFVSVDAAGCWIWTGSLNAFGYGRFRFQDEAQLAHRVSYQLFVGPIPDGLQLDHLCRVHPCVRPEHLEPVTNAENARRGEPAQRTACIHGHPYTPANTGRGKFGRYCRTCHNADQRRREQRRRAAA